MVSQSTLASGDGPPSGQQGERKMSLETLEKKVELPKEKETTGVQLRREIGIFSAVNLTIGSMIGSGIFISPASALARAGSIGVCLIVWAVCGVISLLGALAYAELGTLVPKSGGEYSYFLEAFGRLHKFWGPLPSFLCAWTYILILLPAGNSVVCLTFAEYVTQPFSGYLNEFTKDERDWIKKFIAVCALGLMTIVNLISVKLYVKLQNLFTISKLTACAIVIIGGIYVLCTGKTGNFDNPFENSSTSPKDIVLAFYSGLWAYSGWNAITIVTEELKNPEKNIPRAIGIAVPAVTAVYIMMNIAYMAVLTVPEMLQAPAVAVAFGDRILGPVNFIIPLGVALSTFGAALNGVFSNARLCYVAAREGHMVEFLSYVHVNRLTPAPAVAVQAAIMLAFMLPGNINVLIDFTSFLSWIFIALAMVALILMRFTKKDDYRPYKVSIAVPIITIIVAIFLAMVPIVVSPSVEYLIAVGLLVLGFVVYVPLIYYKKTPKRLMNKLTHIVQKVLNVVPPEKEIDATVKK